jgi:ATP-dependent Clp protease adaptor protein ClpS
MNTDTEVVVEKRKTRGPKEPGRFCVIFHNDDMTPMEFVMQVLETIFHHEEQAARDLTMSIHEHGRAIVGVYSYEVAEQKAMETVVLARNNGFPLAVTVEAE